MEEVILVTENDEAIGRMGKMEAHEQGLLHRAFSVFIFNSQNKMLLQQRAFSKYHSGGLWTNACCSHPRPDEPVAEAAVRRLNEELGFSTPITRAFSFLYHATFANGLTEHEYDHVYVGRYDGPVEPNPGEVHDYAYKSLDAIKEDLQANPARYTAWFHIAVPKLQEWLLQQQLSVKA